VERGEEFGRSSITEPTDEEVQQRIRELILECAPSPRDLRDDSALIEDLGYHSLALAELMVAILDEFEIEELPGDLLVGLYTVRDVENAALLFKGDR
jgi:acyl carrier protein